MGHVRTHPSEGGTLRLAEPPPDLVLSSACAASFLSGKRRAGSPSLQVGRPPASLTHSPRYLQHPHTLLLPVAPICTEPRTPGKGCLANMPIESLAAQLHSAAQKERQIKCQLIVSVEEALI